MSKPTLAECAFCEDPEILYTIKSHTGWVLSVCRCCSDTLLQGVGWEAIDLLKRVHKDNSDPGGCPPSPGLASDVGDFLKKLDEECK